MTHNLPNCKNYFYRDSHPLLVPVLQKKKSSKTSKTISKERFIEEKKKTLLQIFHVVFSSRLKDDRDIDDLLSFIEGPSAKVKNEKKKKVKKSVK